MVDASDFASTVSAWQEAAQELSIEVVSPFTFEHEGRTHKCIAWLPHFYSKNGVLIFAYGTVDNTFIADAQQAGHAYSIINMKVYAKFDRAEFVETLMDWGYFGPEGKKPAWYHGQKPWC